MNDAVASRHDLHPVPTSEGRRTRLLIMGPQGSGKGSQAKRLAQDLGVLTISTGEIFRKNIAEGTELGKLAQEYTNRGELVPDEVTDKMVRDRLGEPDLAGGFILDGYPRNAAQVVALDETLAVLGFELDGVIELVVPDDVLRARIAKRTAEEGREDDNEETIARRLAIYASETEPLLATYGERGLRVRSDAVGNVEEVNDKILAAMAEQLG